MAPKTLKSQVGVEFCCGWGNCHICHVNTFKSSRLFSKNFFFKLSHKGGNNKI
jgi:hypothetical protein